MAETRVRRKRTLLLGAPIFVTGLALVAFSEPRSNAQVLGAILLLATIVPAGMFLNWFAKPRTRYAAAPAFEADQPFVAHVAAELTLEPDIAGAQPQGQYDVILAVGNQGFTTRFVVTGGGALRPGVAQRIDVQFLRPEAALRYFPPGGAFSVIERGRPVAKGRVLELLGP
jgi:hypothetical protein